jgi:hypothetical protein
MGRAGLRGGRSLGVVQRVEDRGRQKFLLYKSDPVKLSELKKLLEEMKHIMDEESKKLNWAGFVETTIVNFFQQNDLEKLSVEDGMGNKAKFTRQKDNAIKVEYTSTTTL